MPEHWRKQKALSPTSGLVSCFLYSPPEFWWKGHCSVYCSCPCHSDKLTALGSKQNCCMLLFLMSFTLRQWVVAVWDNCRLECLAVCRLKDHLSMCTLMLVMVRRCKASPNSASIKPCICCLWRLLLWTDSRSSALWVHCWTFVWWLYSHCSRHCFVCWFLKIKKILLTVLQENLNDKIWCICFCLCQFFGLFSLLTTGSVWYSMKEGIQEIAWRKVSKKLVGIIWFTRLDAVLDIKALKEQ